MISREAITTEAQSWLGTPYEHGQLLKGVGVDCGMILVGVYGNVGIIPDQFRPENYPPDWHLHKTEEMFASYVLRFAREIALEEVQPGDIALWKFGKVYSHAGIFLSPELIVHAVRKDHCVVLSDPTRDSDLVKRPARYFTPLKELLDVR